MTVALAIPPLTVKNRPCALIRSCALNCKNMVLHTHILVYSVLNDQRTAMPRDLLDNCLMDL